MTDVVVSRPAVALMGLATLTLFAASAIHFGIPIPTGGQAVHDSFAAAALPEAIIGVVLAVGTVASFSRWSHRRAAATGTTAFAVAGVVFGLTFTIRGARAGDIVYHIALLAILLAAAWLLLRTSSPHEPAA